jgi:hypothetical protein
MPSLVSDTGVFCRLPRVVAPTRTPKPADLTTIAKKNSGTFPFEATVRIIDGRATLRAHGDPDMPVWGEIFRDNPAWEMTRRAGVRGTLVLITEYLQRIQEK